MILAIAAAALGADADLHGDVKTFFVTSVPVPFFETELPGFDAVDDPTGQGTLDVRLKGSLRLGEHWRFEAHHAVSAFNVPTAVGLGGTSSGVALTAPELIPLTWEPDTGAGLTIRGRTDRLTAKLSVPGVDLTLGRQPVTFGTGLIFTPMDVVNPFSAATIDTEYKPGIDAVRLDGYTGTAGRLSGVVAWASASDLTEARDRVTADDLILALNGQTTVGVTDVQLLAGAVRGEGVFGAGLVSAIGPIGVHGDATLTLPGLDARQDDPFVRAMIGADGRPTGTTGVSLEAYYQGLGAASPAGYLDVLGGPRAARAEIWQAGRWYGALAVSQEVTPLVAASAALIANLADPSALLTGSLSWSSSDSTTVALGAFAGLGARPQVQPLALDPDTQQVVLPPPAELSEAVRSEYGLFPPAFFASMKAYF